MIKDPKEWCSECGGDYPGYGPKTTECMRCHRYFCGKCFEIHNGIPWGNVDHWSELTKEK